MPHAHILRAASAAPADTITLAYDDRWKRRARLTSDGGTEFVLDLPEASELRGGMALELDDGREIAIVAAPEPLTEVLGHDPLHLLRLCWHLGNRHLPVQIEAGRLVIRRDRVLEDMLRQLGAHLHEITEPFTPEGGAYGHGRTHGHSHGDAHADPNAHISADDRDYDHHGQGHGRHHHHDGPDAPA